MRLLKRLQKSFFLYWSDQYETSVEYVKLNFRNILFMTIFGLFVFIIIIKKLKAQGFSILKVESWFFITLLKPLSSNLYRIYGLDILIIALFLKFSNNPNISELVTEI